MSLSSLLVLLNQEAPHIMLSSQSFKQADLAIAEGLDDSLQDAFGGATPGVALMLASPIPDTSSSTATFPAQITAFNHTWTVSVTIIVDTSDFATLLISLPLLPPTSATSGWRWSDTFPMLNGYPFEYSNGLSITWNNPIFVFASQSAAYQYGSSAAMLSSGLNFIAGVAAPVIAAVGQLFGLNTDLLVMSGTVDPSVVNLDSDSLDGPVLYPLLDLRAPLDNTSFTIGTPSLYQLTIEAPDIALRIGSPGIVPPNQSPGQPGEQYTRFVLEGTLSLAAATLGIEMSLPPKGGYYQLSLVPDPTGTITFEDIAAIVPNIDLSNDIPEPLEEIFSSIGLLRFSINVLTESIASLVLVIGANQPWTINSDFTLDQLSMAVYIFPPFNSANYSVRFQGQCRFLPSIFEGTFSVLMAADLSSIEMNYQGTVAPLDLLDALVGDHAFPLAFGEDFVLTDFGINVDRRASTFSFYADSEAATTLSVLGQPLTASLAFIYTRSTTSYYQFAGGIGIGGNRFQFTADSTWFSASWQAIDASVITIGDLLSSLGFNTANGLDLFEFSFDGIAITYNFGTSLTVQLFASIDLTEIPLIGTVLPTTAGFSLQGLGFQVTFTSGTGGSQDATATGQHRIDTVDLLVSFVGGGNAYPLVAAVYEGSTPQP